jgi:hypothetical protein
VRRKAGARRVHDQRQLAGWGQATRLGQTVTGALRGEVRPARHTEGLRIEHGRANRGQIRVNAEDPRNSSACRGQREHSDAAVQVRQR